MKSIAAKTRASPFGHGGIAAHRSLEPGIGRSRSAGPAMLAATHTCLMSGTPRSPRLM